MKTRILIILALGIFLASPLLSQSTKTENTVDVTSVVKQIYTTVSKAAGEEVNWDEVRAFFVPEAVILLQTSMTESSLFTVEEFIADFKAFYSNDFMKDRTFKESVLGMESQIYKDIAYVGVFYKAQIIGMEAPPTKGLDFWLLNKTDAGWKVVSVVNEVVTPDAKIPEIFESK